MSVPAVQLPTPRPANISAVNLPPSTSQQQQQQQQQLSQLTQPSLPRIGQTPNSSLVETVSINYDDFTDTFLTCATCLCSYDQKVRRPKLLSCSHTVCQHCLQRIVELPQTQDTGNFRCPICRETHQVPHAGVQAIPPSFLVNQLIDLMQRQRRDVVPKCNDHPTEELMFCETCDSVFCSQCKENDQSSQYMNDRDCYVPERTQCHNHTIVPFSIAIKRMSEILLYKANQCVRNLNRAADNVAREQNQLDANVDRILDEVNASFQDLSRLLDDRRHQLVNSVRKTRDEKRKVLQEQLAIIQAEKAKVEQQCSGLQYQVEVRSITRRIGDLNDKLDQTLTLVEPRENSFLRYDSSTEQVLQGIQDALGHFGTLSVSRTFPPLCTARSLGDASVHLLNHVLVNTIDYNGQPRTTGGDPVEAKLVAVHAKIIDNQDTGAIGVQVTDNNDGTYDLAFRPSESGEYRLSISIFGRSIKCSPLMISVSEHHAPVWQLGGDQLCQPVRVAATPDNRLFVLDTGNSRVVSLSGTGECTCVVGSHVMLDGSAVGLAVMPPVNGCRVPASLLTLNWRSRTVTEWSVATGLEVRSFTFSEFSEPIDLSVDSRGRVLVADNGSHKVFVFDNLAHPLFSFPVADPTSSVTLKPSNNSSNSPSTKPMSPRRVTKNSTLSASSSSPITCLTIGLNDDILVGRGGSIQVYDNTGTWQRQINVVDLANGTSGRTPPIQRNDKASKATIGGLAVDGPTGVILSTVTDRQRTYVQICGYKGQLAYTMDSHGAKLKRPSGICVTTAGDECIVADLGNNCVKKYKFK